MRLLSFISEIEKALVAQSPAGEEGSWATLRVVNFGSRQARLTLVPRGGDGVTAARAAVAVHAVELLDGTRGLRAAVEWPEGRQVHTVTIYARAQADWTAEAARIAAVMLDGPAAAAA